MVDWVPILLMLIIAVGFALVSLGVSYLLSPKNPTPEKLAPYECGIFPEEEPSQRFPVKFYMVAMLYIVFDIEIIFLLAWATRFNELGWYGILVIAIFSFFTFLLYFHNLKLPKKGLEAESLKNHTLASPPACSERRAVANSIQNKNCGPNVVYCYGP